MLISDTYRHFLIGEYEGKRPTAQLPAAKNPIETPTATLPQL